MSWLQWSGVLVAAVLGTSGASSWLTLRTANRKTAAEANTLDAEAENLNATAARSSIEVLVAAMAELRVDMVNLRETADVMEARYRECETHRAEDRALIAALNARITALEKEVGR